jgi:hypothetical protein
MIKISIEVRSSTARFKVALVAESIEGALEMAKRYNPGKECKVVPYRPRELLRRESFWQRWSGWEDSGVGYRPKSG